MSPQHAYKNILCIRADNMGDILMSGPALSALKETFHCRLTLLTSPMGKPITPFVPGIDEVLTADLPWIKTGSLPSASACQQLITTLQDRRFDLAVIFTVYSQNPLPAAFLCFLAGIPERLALCRENPYHLLTKWLPDKEPYSGILHQVERDLQLVAAIGARTTDDHLHLAYTTGAQKRAEQKLASIGVDLSIPFIILHPGVSEKKREYPLSLWAATADLIRQKTRFQLVVTGSHSDRAKADSLAATATDSLAAATPNGIYSAAGLLTIEEFIAVIARSSLVISVNTATIHIAAAVDTPVVVLYAQTNPQHTPWKVPARVLEFSVSTSEQSRNEVIRHVTEAVYNTYQPFPTPERILDAVQNLLSSTPIKKQYGQVGHPSN
jgi:ADP-heptose:LPS heptosyltransferase